MRALALPFATLALGTLTLGACHGAARTADAALVAGRVFGAWQRTRPH